MNRSESVDTFWALSDPVRIEILDRVAAGSEVTVTRLATAMPITRQAVTRHVRTLENAGLLVGVKRGREQRFRVDPRPLVDAEQWMRVRAASWDRALGRLAEFLDSDDRD